MLYFFFVGLYSIPVGVLIGGLAASSIFHIGDLDNLAGTVDIASAICCIAAIAGLSNQKSARTGNILGVAGVAFGLASTTAEMAVQGATPAAFAQTALLGGLGSGVGAVLAQGVGPTELPQTVAAFHSLVGIAAMAAAAGEYTLNSGALELGTLSSIYLAVFIGGITATGSMVAFAKLAGILGSKALRLPGRDQLNLFMASISALGMALFLFPSLASGILPLDPEVIRVACLSVIAIVSSLLGVHLTASIGGADMPVVITVLNSYSGWALVGKFSSASEMLFSTARFRIAV
jgi:NAD(P) transhydrogenase